MAAALLFFYLRLCPNASHIIRGMKNRTDQDQQKADRNFEKVASISRMNLRLRAVLATKEGRAVVRWIADDLAGCDRSSFNTNALSMAFNEGKRSVGLVLLDRCRAASIDDFNLMQEESNE